MQFRLTYDGPLYATQRDPRPGQPARHKDNKHDIRSRFHVQLRELWTKHPGLNDSLDDHPPVIVDIGGESFVRPLTKAPELAERHQRFGFSFVPLVTKEFDLNCAIEILFLRPEHPGAAISGGDIDNRLKTLLDAMRMPVALEGYEEREPSEDQKPLYCLLEDDSLISRVSVETDRMLEPVNGSLDAHHARLIVTVKLSPYTLTIWNMHFG